MPTYLELTTSTDPSAADPAARLAEWIADADRLFTSAIEPDDLDAVAERIALEPWTDAARQNGHTDVQRVWCVEHA
jgi:hypothetical protein